MFQSYLNLGIQHILDIQAYDHLLFLLALIAPYSIKEWRKLIILATAFTIGHSLTLALVIFELIQIDAGLVETLIPITIILTGLYNLWSLYSKNDSNTNTKTSYGIAAFFGLIHGLGFSNFLRSMLIPGEEGQIVWQLLAFNIGIEIAQVIIIITALLILTALVKLFDLKQLYWTVSLSVVAICVSIMLLFS